MVVQVSEQRLAGIGHRYEMAIDRHHSLIVLVHDRGRRRIAIATPGEERPDVVVSLTHDQAVALAALLIGARLCMEAAEDRIAAGGELATDGPTVRATSPVAAALPDQIPAAAECDSTDTAKARSRGSAET